MKYNLKIALATATLCILASCVKQVNLYQDKEDDGTEDGEGGKDDGPTSVYMYPFDKEETGDITTEIIIRTNKTVNAKNLQAETPYLKYNKSWLLMLTQDDCSHSAFCRTWAVINGKPLSSSIPYATPTLQNPDDKHELYYNVRQFQQNDLPPNVIREGQPLGFTDGTGKEVRFSLTTTLAPQEKWMDETITVQPGFKDNYYRFYMKSGLVWDNVKEMLNYGTGIALHNVKVVNEKDPNQLLEAFPLAQAIIREKLAGRECKFMTEPDGNKAYIAAALQYPEIQTMTAQKETTILYPFKVGSDNLHQTVIHREFNNSPDYFKKKIIDLMALPKEERAAICIGVHNTNNDWANFLSWVNKTYGKKGDDSVWFPSQEEYYEYNYRRINGRTRIEQIDERTLKLTVTLPGGKSFYYPSTTINIAGLNKEDVASIESGDAVTGLSYGKHEDGIMLNIDCRKYLVDHAEHYVTLSETDPSNEFNKADALYFVNMLKESDKKKELLNRIK